MSDGSIAGEASAVGSPWLREKRWRGGRVIDGTGREVLTLWLFAALNGGFAAYLDWLVLRPAGLGHDVSMRFAMDAVAALFSVAAAIVIFQALRKTAIWIRYGGSVFEMVTFPGVVGGQLVGIIYTKTKLRPEGGFHLRLACIHRVWSKHGNQNRRSDTVIWHAEEHLVRGAADDDPGRSAIPVGFRIPRDCRPTDSADVNHQVVWTLTASAKTPGVDYEASFEIPVFVTDESDEPSPTIDPVAPYRAPTVEKKAVARRGLRSWTDARGAFHVRFGRWRNMRMTAMWLGFGAILLLIAFFLAHDWPRDWFSRVIVSVIAGGFSLVGVLVMAVVAGTSSLEREVIAERQEVVVRTRRFLISKAWRIASGDILELRLKEDMRFGDRRWFEIQIIGRGGQRCTVAGTVEEAEANWIVERINRQLGRSPGLPGVEC